MAAGIQDRQDSCLLTILLQDSSILVQKALFSIDGKFVNCNVNFCAKLDKYFDYNQRQKGILSTKRRIDEIEEHENINKRSACLPGWVNDKDEKMIFDAAVCYGASVSILADKETTEDFLEMKCYAGNFNLY